MSSTTAKVIELCIFLDVYVLTYCNSALSTFLTWATEAEAEIEETFRSRFVDQKTETEEQTETQLKRRREEGKVFFFFGLHFCSRCRFRPSAKQKDERIRSESVTVPS